MNTQKVRKGTLAVSIISILPHLFCCGIPAIAALLALGSTVGLGAALAANPLYSFVDAYHKPLLILAITGVTVSGILNLIAYRIDCRKAACDHGSCAPKKTKAFRIFLISLALLILDLAWFATEEFVLGLHDHHGHGHVEESHTEAPQSEGSHTDPYHDHHH